MSFIYRHYRDGLEFRRSAIDWSSEQKKEWMLKRLREVVRTAYAETDFYHERLKSIGFDPFADFSFDDFAQIPVLTREDIHRAGASMISKAVPANDRIRNSTGGSTGKPTQIWMGPEERAWNESGIEFALESVGVPAGSRIAFFWGHHLDPAARPTYSEKIRAWALNYRFFDCFRLSPQVFENYHRELEKYSPDCIVAYASALGHFAKYLKEKGIRPENYPRVCFVTGAEKLYPEHREAIEAVFGSSRPVHERYGGRDFGPAAMQFEPQETLDLTVDWSWCLAEPETAEIHSPILITKFHADAMPMIRYRVGDVGRFAASSRSGSPAFELKEVIGREMDGILKGDGCWVHGTQFPHMIKDFPVREFMLIQEVDFSLEMKIVKDTNFSESDRDRILETIRMNTGDLPLKISYVDSIERGPANKWRPVVSKARIP